MYCKSCGKKIDEDSKFCSFCGTKLNIAGLPHEESLTYREFVKHDHYKACGKR